VLLEPVAAGGEPVSPPPDMLAAVCREAEAARRPRHLGSASTWCSSTSTPPATPTPRTGECPPGRTPGCWSRGSTLAFLAANTSTVRLGTGICIVPQRNPVYLAKEDRDPSTGCRTGAVDFGIGVGWLREEFEAGGACPGRPGGEADGRVPRGSCAPCGQDDVSSHNGEFYTLKPCRQYPKPGGRTRSRPVYVGGESEAALARVARSGQGLGSRSTGPPAEARRPDHPA